MDARRYDRNADQLSQIFFHIQRASVYWEAQPALMAQELQVIIERALYLNDELGKMAQKGLI